MNDAPCYFDHNYLRFCEAFMDATMLHPEDLPDIVDLDMLDTEYPMDKAQIAEAVEWAMECHADDCGAFADAFGY